MATVDCVSRPKRNTPTVTFQPEKDVAEILENLKPLGRGEVSRRINEAIRCQQVQAALNIARREAALATARVKLLEKFSRGDQLGGG
jgi:transcription elongation GreA/GreB family factor